MKPNALAAAATLLALCLPAPRAQATCRDVDILDEAVRARSIQHELDDAASDWQEDLTRASLVGDEHDAPLLAGASVTFVQENLFTVHDACPREPILGARPSIDGATAVMSALVSDPAHRLELRPFFAWTSVALDGDGPDGRGRQSQQLAGVAASSPWFEGSWARTADGRQLLRLGSPLVGDVDVLDVDHLRRHWLKVTTSDFDVGHGFGVGAGVEHRPWQALNLMTARGDWTWHDPEAPEAAYQPYAAATFRVAPGGLEGVRAGGRVVADGAFNHGQDWAEGELFAELSVFDGLPAAGPLAGTAVGLTLRGGGRHGCIGLVMSTGTNQADTLLDVPSARNRQDTRIGIYFRIEPTVMRPRS